MKLRLKTSINIAPLIDILFTIIVFFLLSYQDLLSSKAQALQVVLPTAQSKDLNKPEDPVVIVIRKDGSIFWEKRHSLPELEQRLRGVLRKKPGRTFLVQADQEAQLQTVVAVLDLLQKIGVRNSAFLSVRHK